MEGKKYGSVENGHGKAPMNVHVYVPLEPFEDDDTVTCCFYGSPILFKFYVLFYLIYLTIGAVIFSTLEYPEERNLILKLEEARQNFYRTYPNVKDEDLELLINEVVRASNRGVSATRNVSGQPNWSFGQSLFFSGTVVTTIGYGHVTPLSRSGKVFCMIYATCGIPLTLVLLSALVERLLKPTIWLLHWLNSKLGHLYQPLNIRIIHLFIIVCILVAFFLVVPASIFATIEPDWDFLDSFYYCFISLTTIGLGDYIPGDYPNQAYRPLYKIVTTGYLFIGLTFMMLTLAVFYDIPQLNLGILFKTHEDVDPEKTCLAPTGLRFNYGIDSTSNVDDNTHRHVVRVRSRQRDDSPSPDENAPIKDLRLP